MKVVLQRVARASVTVDGSVVGAIGRGLLLLVGIAPGDTRVEREWMAAKCAELRIFPDAAGKMNLSLEDVKGAVLAVSQFTLFGDCRKGRRPSFAHAGPPEPAKAGFEEFVALLKARGLPVETGIFAAEMQVELVNDGPVTLMLESPERPGPPVPVP